MAKSRQGSAQAQAPFVSSDFALTAQLNIAASADTEPICPLSSGEVNIDLQQAASDFVPAEVSDPPS